MNTPNQPSYRADLLVRLIIEKLEGVADYSDSVEFERVQDRLELAKMLGELTDGGSISDA